MEYLLSIKTNNNTVHFIVTETHFMYNFDYIKNFGELSFQKQNILGKDYLVIADNLDVDNRVLTKYLNKYCELHLNYDFLKIMLYFMDPRIETLLQNNLSDVLANKYDEKINMLLYSHFKYLFTKKSVIDKFIFDENEGKFVEYKLNPFDYKGCY